MTLYRKTVVGVVHQDREFLLVQKPHWKGGWDFPQGGIEERESLEQAVMREMREELGTDAFGKGINTEFTLQRLFSPETLRNYPQKGFDGKELFYLVVPFLGDRDAIVLGDNLSDKTWCDEEGLFKLTYKGQLDMTRQIVLFMKANGLI